MTVYASAAELQDVFTELFARIQQDAARDLGDLVKRKMLVRFRVSDPEVELCVDGRHDPALLAFGPSDQRPTLTLTLTGDALHEVLLGTLPLGKALSSGRLKVKGSLLKARKLESLFHAFQACYPALAKERFGDA